MTKTKIGLGLAALGRPEYINIRTIDAIDKSESAFKKNAFSVLDEAYKLGVRYFDTAPSYGKGEAFLRTWSEARQHTDVVFGTKWGYTYVANWELGYTGKHEVKEHSLTKLLEQWKVSEDMLPKLKYYQVHSATFESGVLENQQVLDQLYAIKKETGMQIGISTSGANQSDVIAAALDVQINGEALLDCFQVTYNVFEQNTFGVLKEVMKQGKTVIIKEALANGRVFQNKKFEHYDKAYKLLTKLSKKYQVGLDAIALRFIMDNLKPTYVLSGASNSNQLTQNLKAMDIDLSPADIDALKLLNTTSKHYWDERVLLNWN